MSKKDKLNNTTSIQPSQLWGYIEDPITSISTSGIYDWSIPILLNTIINEEGVEQVFRQDSSITYTSPFGTQPSPRIYKNVYRIVKGKLKLTETIEGKYIPQQEESYEF